MNSQKATLAIGSSDRSYVIYSIAKKILTQLLSLLSKILGIKKRNLPLIGPCKNIRIHE